MTEITRRIFLTLAATPLLAPRDRPVGRINRDWKEIAGLVVYSELEAINRATFKFWRTSAVDNLRATMRADKLYSVTKDGISVY